MNGAIAAQNPIYAAVDSPHGRYEMVTNRTLTTDSTAPLDRDHQPAAEVSSASCFHKEILYRRSSALTLTRP